MSLYCIIFRWFFRSFAYLPWRWKRRVLRKRCYIPNQAYCLWRQSAWSSKHERPSKYSLIFCEENVWTKCKWSAWQETGIRLPVWRSDTIVILQDTKAAVCLIRRPRRFSNNTFSGFIENVQTDTHTHTHTHTQKDFVCFTKHIARTRAYRSPPETSISTTSLPGIYTICTVFVISGLMCHSSGNSI